MTVNVRELEAQAALVGRLLDYALRAEERAKLEGVWNLLHAILDAAERRAPASVVGLRVTA